MDEIDNAAGVRRQQLEFFKKAFIMKSMAKITLDDIKILKTIFATKNDLKNYATKADIVSFKDVILKEIKDMREEVTLVIGYKDQIEDHEDRIEKIEKHLHFSITT